MLLLNMQQNSYSEIIAIVTTLIEKGFKQEIKAEIVCVAKFSLIHSTTSM